MSHRCDPPCILNRIDDARKARPKMTKAQLLALMDQDDETYLDLTEQRDLLEAAYDDLRAAAKRYRDAEWAIRIEQDAPYEDKVITFEEHNAAVDRWRAADAELAPLIGETSPFTQEGT